MLECGQTTEQAVQNKKSPFIEVAQASVLWVLVPSPKIGEFWVSKSVQCKNLCQINVDHDPLWWSLWDEPKEKIYTVFTCRVPYDYLSSDFAQSYISAVTLVTLMSLLVIGILAQTSKTSSSETELTFKMHRKRGFHLSPLQRYLQSELLTRNWQDLLFSQ